jgi:hypothetical protein
MSWDIHFQDFPDVASVQDIPDDYVPKSIGTRSDVIEKIKAQFQQADFTDPSWGLIKADSWSIEVNIGQDDVCESFTLHVRGGGDAMSAVERIAAATRARGIDMQTSEFFLPDAANQSFGAWQKYRDQVVGEVTARQNEPARKRGFFSRLFSSD